MASAQNGILMVSYIVLIISVIALLIATIHFFIKKTSKSNSESYSKSTSDPSNQKRTVVTGFFNINRESWKDHGRSLKEYYERAKPNMALNENMVIFVEPNSVDFVSQERTKAGLMNKTVIVPMRLEDLPKYALRDKIKSIQESPEFKKGQAAPATPEMCNPDYLIVIWSKTDLVKMAIERADFGSSHYGWMDFGLAKSYRGDLIPKVRFSDKIKILCNSLPQESDLNRAVMAKSHTNRFAACFFTGSSCQFLKFIEGVDKEIDEFLRLNVVDCEQTMYSNVFLLHKDWFDLIFGYWEETVSGHLVDCK